MPRKKINETLLSDNQNTAPEAPQTPPPARKEAAPASAKPAGRRKKAEVLPSETAAAPEQPAAPPAPSAAKPRAAKKSAAKEAPAKETPILEAASPKSSAKKASAKKPAVKEAPAAEAPVAEAPKAPVKAVKAPKTTAPAQKAAKAKPAKEKAVASPQPEPEQPKSAPQPSSQPAAESPAKRPLFGRTKPAPPAAAPVVKKEEPAPAKAEAKPAPRAEPKAPAKGEAKPPAKAETPAKRGGGGTLFPKAANYQTPTPTTPVITAAAAAEYARHNEQILSALVEDDGSEPEPDSEPEVEAPVTLRAVLRTPQNQDRPDRQDRRNPRDENRGGGRQDRRPERAERAERPDRSERPERSGRPERTGNRRDGARPQTPAVELPPLTEAQKSVLDAASQITFNFRTKEEGRKAGFSAGREVSEEEIIASLATSQEIGLDDIPPLVTEVTVGAWRGKDGQIAAVPPAPVKPVRSEDESDDNAKGWRRKDRRGGRNDRRDRPERASTEEGKATVPTEEEPVIVAPVAPAPPAKKEKIRIPVPVDAPQIVLHQGVPTLVADKKIIAPLFLYLGGPTPNLSQQDEQVRTAAEAGVNCAAFPVKLEVSDEGVDTALFMSKQRMEAVIAANPQAQFVLQVCFTFASGWEAKFADAKWRATGDHEARASFCDDNLWQKAEESLTRFIKGLQSGPHSARLLGIHLDRHSWHYLDDEGYDDSPSARRKFGKWLRHRYGNDLVSLRASWFDGKVTFDDVSIPNYAKRHGTENDFVRLDRRARRWVDYNLFLSDSLVDRISSIAYAAKSAGEGRLLVGVSYGYTFEWSHPASGHLSLGKLLRCAEIDYISGPSSYQTRQPGQTAAFPWPIDSFLLNGKLAIFEEDFRTPIGKSEDNDPLPMMKTPQALEAAHWRGAGAALAHGGGLNWMDMRGQGWLNSRGIWERGSKVLQALNWRISTPMKDPDVALMIDERSLAYLADPIAFEELVQDVREALLRSGMSVGFYLLSDLAHRENFPEARLFIFVNAWDIRPEVRSSIKARLQKDDKVLFWLYSAGLFEAGRESLERAREVTGIALRPQPFNSKPGTNLVNVRDPLCRTLPNDMMAEGGTLEPSYFAIPEDATVLGEYSQTGLPSFVVRKFPSPNTNDEPWTSVFLGEPLVTPGLFKALGQMAGCHIYSLDDDVIHVSAPFLSLHCAGAGVRTINLPDKWICYDLIQRVWMPVENNTLKFLGLDGSTYSFLIGHKADIEQILVGAPDSAVSEAEILAHQDNTIRWDAIRFDVPIMKLDEWVEESWGEELADDLLIKPSMLEEVGEDVAPEAEREAPRSSGQRRKKKRTTTKGRQDPGQQAQEQAQTVNFLFRKRE